VKAHYLVFLLGVMLVYTVSSRTLLFLLSI